jgi:glycosyltransferase involved in cell wall biosynthesis
MKYLVINPYFNGSNGIDNYIKNTMDALQDFMDVELLSNNKNLSKKAFQKEVFNYITSNYGTEEVLIEAPEARAATLLLPKSYKVHIRLHCPLAIAQKYDGFEPDETIYSEELRVIHKAQVVSSPSYGLLREMKDEMDIEKSFVFKNPYNKNIKLTKFDEKEFDVVFMGRFQKLKGIEYLNPILERLPENYKVLLIGNNSSKFKLSKQIKCNVTVREHIISDERFELVGKAKTLIMLSRFENCSMVILESLAAGTVVTCWDVGGNSEIAPPNVMQVVPFEDIEKFVTEIRKICETQNYPSIECFKSALNEIQNDFNKGIKSVVNSLLNTNDKTALVNQDMKDQEVYKGLNCSEQHKISYESSLQKKHNIVELNEKNPFGKRVLGFTISNEHIEEMWVPVVRKLGLKAKYVCRRPLGFRKVFNNPFPLEEKEFTQFDWIKNPNRLILKIYNYKPNKLLFHNGLHPMYQDVLNEVKKLGIPIIYSELGWFPQKDHVYFDRWGTNGKSYLASLSAEAFCRKSIDDEEEPKKKVKGEHVLVVTQLENDTNLIVNSPLFKKNRSFVKHVINQVPDTEKIIIKTHPLDKNWEELLEFENERVKVIKEGNLEELLSNAKAVIGINSTVLIQALQYDVNIYSYGYGLLDNKGVTINCIENSLSKSWTEFLVGSTKRRRMIVEGFKSRQINIRELENLTTESLVDNIAFEPFLLANQEDFTELEKYVKKANILPSENSNTNKIKSAKDSKISQENQKNIDKRTKDSKVNLESQKNKNKRTIKHVWIRRWNKFKRNPKIVFTYLARKINY